MRDLAARDRAFAQRCVSDFASGGGCAPSNNPRKVFIRCHHCELACDAKMVETTHPKLPNTLTGLPDYGHALWLCYHCGAWN